MSHQYFSITKRFLMVSSAAILTLTGYTSPVTAQEAESGSILEEITVTGTRIVRRDFVSNSPIVTVETEQFESRTGLNIESYLNQMPNYNPATTPVTGQADVGITPINSVGIASISLRGFGPNRNLVLIDGKRPVPINALMVTDINQIPSAMIARSETITGGASAVYGADAVGGVTNFILRDDFEGLEVDGQYGQTQEGDGEESRLYALLGTNVADGRGNITVAMERYEREEALTQERDYYTDAWTNPLQFGNFLGFLQGVNSYNCLFNCAPAAVQEALFPNKPAGTFAFNPVTGNFFRTFSFNADGTVFANGSTAGLTKMDPSIIDGLKYTLQTVYDNSISHNTANLATAAPRTAGTTTDQLKYNNTSYYTSGPQDRYSIMLNGHYDITDELTFFGRGTWAESKTRTLLGGNSAVYGWEALIPYNPTTDSPINPTAVNFFSTGSTAAVAANPAAYPNPNFIPTGSGAFTYCSAGVAGCPAAGVTDLANSRVGTSTASLVGTPVSYHPVPVELAILLNSRFTPTGTWLPNWNTDDSRDYRNTYNTNTTWQVEGGLNYDLPFKDWTGELYFSHGESSTYNVSTGNMSLARYRALAAQPDYGRGANLSGNDMFLIPGTVASTSTVYDTSRPNFGAADITCESGFYDTFFSGEQRPSQDCIDAINATLQSRTQNQQDIVEVNLQGGVMDLPAGELRSAVGFQYRKNNAQFFPDILQSQQSFTDQVIGVYPTGYLDAETSVKDYYVEALVPIVGDLPYLKKLELETGARYSDYNVAESTWTYKFLGNAEVNDWLRFRGGYNHATRAPNLGELFLNTQETVAFGGVLYGDACAWQSNAPWGASGAMNRPAGASSPGVPSALAGGQTAAGATSTYLICQAQMGGAGSPAATLYYAGGAFGNANAGNAPVLFNWNLQEGTPTLTSEQADTFSAGIIMSSPFDNPWIAGLSSSIDWWKVDIEDAIQLYSIDYANYLCYGLVTVTTAAEAAAQAATPACHRVPRSAGDGTPLTTTLAYSNLATIANSGIDFSVNWLASLNDLGFNLPGRVSINVLATWIDYYKTKASPLPFDIEIDWEGSLGPQLSGTNPGAYEYRVFTNFGYSQDNWSVSLRWRHLPSVVSAGIAGQNALVEHNVAVNAGAPGAIYSYTPSAALEVGSYDVLDLSFNWDINEMFSLRGGIDNIINFEPEITTATAGYPAGTTTLSAVCGSAPGCLNPTSFSLPGPGAGTTSAGFYDTLGRRFFVGVKARF
ncbi:MAG TPA: TonB-dependent receptor [Gammaproteobacteria bacterium]|nr:TonB-dependent receptor [Gammaproteobacteria bacterium]